MWIQRQRQRNRSRWAFCILGRREQLKSETRGRMRMPRGGGGLEANIELDIGIRSMSDIYFQNRMQSDAGIFK